MDGTLSLCRVPLCCAVRQQLITVIGGRFQSCLHEGHWSKGAPPAEAFAQPQRSW